LEGNEAQGSIESSGSLNSDPATTDSVTEQGPGGGPPVRDGDARRATAVVTRYGCQGGEGSEGCDRAVGEAIGSRRSRVDLGSQKHGEPQDRFRNATSPRTLCGGNRRGGEEPRGRNEISRLAAGDRERSETGAGVDAQRSPVEGRRGEPHERRPPEREVSAKYDAFEEEGRQDPAGPRGSGPDPHLRHSTDRRAMRSRSGCRRRRPTSRQRVSGILPRPNLTGGAIGREPGRERFAA
jgi:hypothetical protein